MPSGPDGEIRAQISMRINSIQSANGLDAGLLDPDPRAQDRLDGATTRRAEFMKPRKM